jgi:hypothetical protein
MANDQARYLGSSPLPGLAQDVSHEDSPGRDFRELSESGLLWLINAVVFHPRGFALAFSMDTLTGQVTGWDIVGNGTEPWQYADRMKERFAAAEATLASHRSPGRRAQGFTCPRCGRTSYNPTDLTEGYCGACHDWTAPPRPAVEEGRT